MKQPIVESGSVVTDLNVVLVARDCEGSLPYTLSLFESWQETYDCNFNFVFVENGSKDDTRQLLEKFVKGRTGVVATPDLADVIEAMPRVMRISEARNKARELVDPAAQWTVIIDSDIYCDPVVLSRFFAHNPTHQNIAMICAFGTQVMFENGEMRFSDHYYDTFAFTTKSTDSFGNTGLSLHYPWCIFSGCLHCETKGDIEIERLEREGIHDVASAFGGMAIVETSSMLLAQVKWSCRHQPELSVDGAYTCEHIDFCRSLELASGKRIVVATDCVVRWDGFGSPTFPD